VKSSKIDAAVYCEFETVVRPSLERHLDRTKEWFPHE